MWWTGGEKVYYSNNLLVYACRGDSLIKSVSQFSCSNYRCFVSFEEYNITQLTSFAFHSPESNDFRGVKLSNNFIKSVDTDAFKPLTSVRVISLRQNNITSLPHGLFGSNTLLLTVDLSYNNIYVIDNTTFPLNCIKNLNLQHNRLQDLNFTLPFSLVNLELSFNLISHIARDSFIKMFSLETIILENNNLKTFAAGCFRDLHSLDVLSLSHNRIEVKDGCLGGLQNLTVLNIANNSIQNLLPITSHLFENLITLNFENNSVSRFNVQDVKSHLKKLAHLYLFGNPFNCYDLRKIIIDLSRNGITVPKGHEYFVENVKGIPCNNKLQATTVSEDDIEKKWNVQDDNIKSYAFNNVVDQPDNTKTILNTLSSVSICMVFILMVLLILLALKCTKLYLKFRFSNTHVTTTTDSTELNELC